ncbi:14283_t:CDS:1, partial [Racocetra persica]
KLKGLFNKLDLKTHPNMSISTKQSKLCLSSSKVLKENYLDELNEIRAKRNLNKKKMLLQE